MRDSKSTQLDKKLIIKIHSGASVEGDRRPYVFIGANSGDRPPTRIWLPASDATDASKIVSSLLSAGLEFNDPVFIRRTVADALKQVTPHPTRAAVRCGWHGKLFVFDRVVYGENLPPHLFIHQDLIKTDEGAPTVQDDNLIGFLNEVGKMSDFIVAATLIAFAQPLIGMLPSSERPVIYLWGESRTGKSTICTLINALSRTPHERNLRAFDATDRAFEEILQDSSDNVAVFDELRVVQDSELEHKLSPFIYMAANGRGKSRSKGANFPNLRWRTTTVINSEWDVGRFRAKYRGGGQDARFLVLPVPKREEGGVWAPSMPQEARRTHIETLDRLCATYSGRDYRKWLAYLSKRYDKVLFSFEASVKRHTLALAGEGADGVTLSRAQKYAQIIAAGDELLKWGLFEWDIGLPFEAVQRLYNADLLPSDSVPNVEDKTRRAAIDILAHVGGGAIPFLEGVDVSRKAYRRKSKGDEVVMIKSGNLAEFVSAPASEVAAAFKSAGASVTAGNSPFFQCKKSGERYLRISMAQLNRLALGL